MTASEVDVETGEEGEVGMEETETVEEEEEEEVILILQSVQVGWKRHGHSLSQISCLSLIV